MRHLPALTIVKGPLEQQERGCGNFFTQAQAGSQS